MAGSSPSCCGIWRQDERWPWWCVVAIRVRMRTRSLSPAVVGGVFTAWTTSRTVAARVDLVLGREPGYARHGSVSVQNGAGGSNQILDTGIITQTRRRSLLKLCWYNQDTLTARGQRCCHLCGFEAAFRLRDSAAFGYGSCSMLLPPTEPLMSEANACPLAH
jgi:hypothetical protein